MYRIDITEIYCQVAISRLWLMDTDFNIIKGIKNFNKNNNSCLLFYYN